MPLLSARPAANISNCGPLPRSRAHGKHSKTKCFCSLEKYKELLTSRRSRRQRSLAAKSRRSRMSRSERTNAMSRMSRAGLSLSLRTSLYQTNSSNGSLQELGVVGCALEERCCMCSGDGSALPLSYNTTAAVAAATRANSSFRHWVEWVSRYGTLRCKSAAGNRGHYHDRGHGARAGAQGVF